MYVLRRPLAREQLRTNVKVIHPCDQSSVGESRDALQHYASFVLSMKKLTLGLYEVPEVSSLPVYKIPKIVLGETHYCDHDTSCSEIRGSEENICGQSFSPIGHDHAVHV